MSGIAELGARGRSTFGKRYFWTACIHILEYLLCKPRWYRASLNGRHFHYRKVISPSMFALSAGRVQSSKALVIVEVNDSTHGRVKRVSLGFLSPLNRASSRPPVPRWLRTRCIPPFPSVHGQANWLCWMSIWTSDPLNFYLFFYPKSKIKIKILI